MPEYSVLKQNTKLKITVQVCGKARGFIEIQSENKEEWINCAKDAISKLLSEKEIKDVIIIKDNVINFMI